MEFDLIPVKTVEEDLRKWIDVSRCPEKFYKLQYSKNKIRSISMTKKSVLFNKRKYKRTDNPKDHLLTVAHW